MHVDGRTKVDMTDVASTGKTLNNMACSFLRLPKMLFAKNWDL